MTNELNDFLDRLKSTLVRAIEDGSIIRTSVLYGRPVSRSVTFTIKIEDPPVEERRHRPPARQAECSTGAAIYGVKKVPEWFSAQMVS